MEAQKKNKLHNEAETGDSLGGVRDYAERFFELNAKVFNEAVLNLSKPPKTEPQRIAEAMEVITKTEEVRGWYPNQRFNTTEIHSVGGEYQVPEVDYKTEECCGENWLNKIEDLYDRIEDIAISSSLEDFREAEGI